MLEHKALCFQQSKVSELIRNVYIL